MRREVKYGSLLTINTREVERKYTNKSREKCNGGFNGGPYVNTQVAWQMQWRI